MTQDNGGPSSPQSNVFATPPIVASIGTVLIDAFDSPPRPITDNSPSPSPGLVPVPNPGIGLPTPPTDPSPVIPNSGTVVHPQPNLAHRVLPVPSHLATPITSPINSAGPSTPQLSLEDVPSPSPDEVYEMLGGGALYALVGARLWLPPTHLRTLVDRAPENEDDLSSESEDKLNSLGKDIWVWNRGEGTKMTRARIRYEGDVRFFQSIVKGPHRTMDQLVDSPLFGSKYLHISPPYSPEDVSSLIEQMNLYNNLNPDNSWEPKIIFEPTPPSCHPGQKEWLEKIVPHIEVLSPNHEEIMSILSIPTKEIYDPELIPIIENIIKYFIYEIGIGKEGNGIMLIRCGKLGACVGTKEKGLKWCPAFFEGDESKDRVKDVTGAGNSFLGGYIAGLRLSDDNPYEALLYATVSASFVVEQFGLPNLTEIDGIEMWNDDEPKKRLDVLRSRVNI